MRHKPGFMFDIKFVTEGLLLISASGEYFLDVFNPTEVGRKYN